MPHRSRLLPHLLLALLLGLPLAPCAGPAFAEVGSDDWRKRLGRADPDDVYRAIRQAEQTRDPSAALPLIETALSATFPHLAVAAGDALRAIGPGPYDDPAVKKLLRKLQRGKDPAVLENAARCLAGWNRVELDGELAWYASGRRDSAVQSEALFLVGGMEFQPDATRWKALRAAVAKAVRKGRTEDIRRAACTAAGQMRLVEAANDVRSLATRSRDEYTGLYAVWALKEMGAVGDIGPFLHVLKSNPKRRTRQACLKGVTELSTLANVPELLALSRSAKKDHRDAAMLALGRLAWRAEHGHPPGQPQGAQPVVTGAKEPDPAGKHRLPNPKLDVPAAVIERCIQVVEEDAHWEVRDAARQALIRFGERARERVQAAMPELVFSGDYDASLTGIELCGLFGARSALDDLLKVAQFDKDPVRRIFAARALEGVAPKAAVTDLRRMIRPGKRARAAQLHAVRALGYIRHPAAFDVLVKVFEPDAGEFPEALLREVELSLERLTGHRFGRQPEIWRKWAKGTKHPLHPGLARFDRAKNRRQAVEKHLYGLTPVTEKAVEKGLRWLELQQHANGAWDGSEKGFGGVNDVEPAYTGLSLLAFLGAGYNERTGRYREAIRRATQFLAATQFYDGGFPVTGGGDQSWIYAYVIAMGVWGVNESYALSGDVRLSEPAQWGVDYLVRVQTPGAGWRYGPRYKQSDTSCTSWVMMTMKTADLSGLDVAQRSMDGIDWWLERCMQDVTGEVEILQDLASDYDYEVGARRYFKKFAGYFVLEDAKSSSLQQVSMTAVMMVCRFFQGWKRSHPFMIGASNYLSDYLPQWMKGLEKGMAIAWYHYYWYYGSLAFHQMGGRYWRKWNEKIKRMYPEHQRTSPPELAGSWDPGTAVYNGGRVFSTTMSILSLESYYRFSPLTQHDEPEED